MAPVTNTQIILNEVPQGLPDPEKVFRVDKSQVFDIDTAELNGGIAVKILSLSVDPFHIGRMRMPKEHPLALIVGKTINGPGVAVVLKSEVASISAGDHLYGYFPFAEYAILPDASNLLKVDKPGEQPWSVYVGVAGMPGQTAYHGYAEYVHDYAKKGDTLFVTTGAGAVGSLVIQLAKRQGLKVIASAGSEEKVKFMQECGADVAFNYKTTSTKEILAQHGPINFYWDHVGGESLDLAMEAAAPFARFIIVGIFSTYGSQNVSLKDYTNILYKSINMQGFIVTNLMPKYNARFYEEIPPLVASGDIKFMEYTKRGLENSGQILLDIMTGKNTGKAVIIAADE